jgi:spore coat polysaccharide biosynthesis predicted glycosyltransferase SpsG
MSVIKIAIFCDLSSSSGLSHIKRMISINNSIKKIKKSKFFWKKIISKIKTF